MDINLFKTFVEVYRVRHFGKAADNLYITQSAVSARIQLLERQLGVKLFIRRRNDIQLTPAGLRLLPHIETILHTWSRASQEIALEGDDRTLLLIGIESSIWNTELQSWLNTIYEKYPDIAFNIQTASADILRKKLLDGSLDLALVMDPPQQEELTIEKVSTIQLIMVSSEQDITLQDSLQNHYIFVDWGAAFAVAHAIHFPETPSPAIRISTPSIALQFLLEHGGQAYLAESSVNQHISEKSLYQVKEAPIIKRALYSIFSQKSDREETIAKVLSLFGNEI